MTSGRMPVNQGLAPVHFPSAWRETPRRAADPVVYASALDLGRQSTLSRFRRWLRGFIWS